MAPMSRLCYEFLVSLLVKESNKATKQELVITIDSDDSDSDDDEEINERRKWSRLEGESPPIEVGEVTNEMVQKIATEKFNFNMTV